VPARPAPQLGLAWQVAFHSFVHHGLRGGVLQTSQMALGADLHDLHSREASSVGPDGPRETVRPLRMDRARWRRKRQSCPTCAVGTDWPLAVRVTSTLPRVALE
jgi:hypothetical protein